MPLSSMAQFTAASPQLQPVLRVAQLRALDHGYTYGLLWMAGVAVLVGGAALLIGYTSAQVAHAQEVKDAIDSGDL